MIAKCQTTEIQAKIKEYIKNAEWDFTFHAKSQFWMGKLANVFDAIWTLYVIDAISQKTFDALYDPIWDFEFKHGIKLICDYNSASRVFN